MAVVAFAALLGVSGLFRYGYQQHVRKQVAEGVEQFVSVSYLPGPEVFEEFDAIHNLQPVSFSTDEDLLAALQ
jgi:hypothetical protein